MADLWNPSAENGAVKMRPNLSGVSRTVVSPPMMERECKKGFMLRNLAKLRKYT